MSLQILKKSNQYFLKKNKASHRLQAPVTSLVISTTYSMKNTLQFMQNLPDNSYGECLTHNIL